MIRKLPTHFQTLDVAWEIAGRGAMLRLSGNALPPDGFLLPLPDSLKAQVSVGGRAVERSQRGFVLPPETKQAEIQFGL
jgi:hypothetical protein